MIKVKTDCPVGMKTYIEFSLVKWFLFWSRYFIQGFSADGCEEKFSHIIVLKRIKKIILLLNKTLLL